MRRNETPQISVALPPATASARQLGFFNPDIIANFSSLRRSLIVEHYDLIITLNARFPILVYVT
jgi:hypothetical protein